MAEEIGFENGRNSNCEGLMTLTLTLDPAIRHTVVHHSSTSTYIPNFIEIEETFCGRTDGRTDVRTDVRTDIFPPLILLGRLLEVDLKTAISTRCTDATVRRCAHTRARARTHTQRLADSDVQVSSVYAIVYFDTSTTELHDIVLPCGRCVEPVMEHRAPTTRAVS